jgi:hypothetical protein
MGKNRALTILAAAALAAGACAAASAADPTPYGMDAVPGSDFYMGAWAPYGSDPVPRSSVDESGFVDIYGLDAIPDAFIPTIHDLKHALPHQVLLVLTRAIEGGDLNLPAATTTSASGCCER